MDGVALEKSVLPDNFNIEEKQKLVKGITILERGKNLLLPFFAMWIYVENIDIDFYYVIISVYGPTNTATNTIKNSFWSKLRQNHNEIKKLYPSAIIIYGGDFNASVGEISSEISSEHEPRLNILGSLISKSRKK